MSVSEAEPRIYGSQPNWYVSYRKFLRRCVNPIRLTNYPVARQLLAETLGTMILIFYGDGSVAQKFFFDSTFLEISLGWGAAVIMGIIIAGGKASPAYLNPAVAMANAVTGGLHWALLPAYIALEVLGGFIGAGLLLLVYNEKLIEYTKMNDNGQFLVNSTGGIFVAGKNSPVGTAVLDQIITTGLLMFGIMAVGDNRLMKKPSHVVPILVGMVVYMSVGTYTANASSALNPARDLGPRILLLASHWGLSAFTIDNYYFWVPALMPLVGAVLGALIYQLTIGIHAVAVGGGGSSNELTEDDDDETQKTITSSKSESAHKRKR